MRQCWNPGWKGELRRCPDGVDWEAVREKSQVSGRSQRQEGIPRVEMGKVMEGRGWVGRRLTFNFMH